MLSSFLRRRLESRVRRLRVLAREWVRDVVDMFAIHRINAVVLTNRIHQTVQFTVSHSP